ncbi:hypothetical protein DFH06DRAFT_1139025 [Mycena polygramma]|nr:hypothetical protein DFH06DRAFT_1139025 [Mycena polygramma]
MPNQDIHPSRFNGVLPNTEANLIRRRSNFPKDRYLDFDKPMLGLVWIKDGEPAAQVTLYPREDMRVRLSDHKVALAAAGFEQGTGAIAVYMEGIGEARGWHACTWDTPVRRHEGQYPSYRWPTVKRVETARARHNRIVCGLRTQYEEAKRTSACIKNERDRYEGSYEQMVAYHRECSIYEDAYGKFVPDSENARWFDRINPRIAEMLLLREVAGKIEDCNHPDMVRYFVAVNQAQAFEEDFEHGFNGHDANDGLTNISSEWRRTTASAKSLALKCSGDALKLAAFFSKPLEFTIDNPYEEG